MLDSYLPNNQHKNVALIPKRALNHLPNLLGKTYFESYEINNLFSIKTPLCYSFEFHGLQTTNVFTNILKHSRSFITVGSFFGPRFWSLYLAHCTAC